MYEDIIPFRSYSMSTLFYVDISLCRPYSLSMLIIVDLIPLSPIIAAIDPPITLCRERREYLILMKSGGTFSLFHLMMFSFFPSEFQNLFSIFLLYFGLERHLPLDDDWKNQGQNILVGRDSDL